MLKGHSVHEFEISPHGYPQGDPRNFNCGILFQQQPGNERGGGFTAGGRVGCQDNLINRLLLQPSQKSFDFKVFRADALQRGEYTM